MAFQWSIKITGSVNAMSRAGMQPLFSLLDHPSGGRINNAVGTTVTFPQIGSPVP